MTVLDRLIAIQESDDRDKDGVLEHSYWITALAHYARCFSSGKRNTGLSDSVVKQHAPEYLGLHQWMRNMLPSARTRPWQSERPLGRRAPANLTA